MIILIIGQYDARSSVHSLNTFKQTLGVLLIKSEELSGGFANLGQSELDPPHFTLVPQTILAFNED